MKYSFWSVQQNIVRFSHHYVVYGLRHFFSNIFTLKAKEENQTSNNYWSSTTNASNTNNAWNVNFNNGYTNNNNKSNNNNVRCVRAG